METKKEHFFLVWVMYAKKVFNKGTVTIAEVEHLVEPGELDPNEIHTPGIFVHRIFEGKDYEKRIEQRTISQ